MKTLLLVFTLFLTVWMPTVAQEGKQVVRLTGAYEITVPNSWKVAQEISTGFFWESKDSRIRVRTYTRRFLQAQEFTDASLSTVLEWVAVDVLNARDFDPDEMQTIDLGSQSGYTYTIEVLEQGASVEHQVYGYEFTDDAIIIAYIRPLNGLQLNPRDVTELADALATITRAERYTFYDGASVSLSDKSWQVFDEKPTGLAWVLLIDESAQYMVGIQYFPRYGVMAGFENPRDFLAYIWNGNFQEYGGFRRESAQTIRVAGYDAIVHPVEPMTLNGLDMYGRAVIVFELTSNGSYVAVSIMTGERETDYDSTYTLIDTFSHGNRIICPLFASPGISIREEATTNSERVRQTEDETLIAQYDVIGSDGYRWFFVGEGWIRSDVIFFENNTCEGIQRRR